jgi:hypothetical protein
LFFCVQANASESLSYSGRLVQANGSPVTGPVNLRAELVYTNNTSVVLCSDDVASVALAKGVFHVKLDFTCTGGKTLTQVLALAPVNESVAIQITDVTNSKSYSFQAIHAIPYANVASVASQLEQNGAGDGEFLKWNDTLKQWKPGTVSGASGGTVTNVSVSGPLSVATPTSTPAISISQANTTTSGYLSSADWNTFNSKEGTIAGGTATQFYRGDKSWQTLDSSVVPENVNLYFTNARVLGVPLTGFATAAGAIVATDTTLQAFGKTQGQINAINTASASFLIKNTTDSITGLVNVGTTGLLQLSYVPVGMNDATNKSYVDTKLNLTGGILSGVLTLDDDLKIKGGTNYVTIKGHATSANYNLVLPSTAGTTGYVLQTDGSGNLSWINPSAVSAGVGTVDSSSITNGSIVDADINATAAIAQSKIANLTTDLAAKVSTTLSNGNILVGNGSNVASAVAVSGDATLSNTGALTLVNTAVTAGTYKSVTVDGKGRVTGGTNPSTLAGYGITDTLVTGVSVTAPITNTGTAAVPLIGMPAATTSVNGYLTSTDWNTFNNKQAAITTTSNVAMRELRLNELTVNGPEYIGFKSPDALTATVIYTLPSTDGSNGQALTTNSTGGLSWTTVATSSSSLTGDIGGSIGANTIGAGKVTLTHLSATGTKDNTTYLRGDNTFATFAADVRTTLLTGLSTLTNAVIAPTDSVLGSLGKLQKQISDFAVSAVGGDLTGNLPNPTVAKIRGVTVAATAPLAGQVFKYNSVTPAWEPSYVLVGDLKSSALGNLFPGTGCAANQTLYYSVVGDAFSCVNIDLLDAGKITTGTIAAARLPASATYWTAATGGINYAGGNVGVGTSTPNATLDVVTTSGGAPTLRLANTATNTPYLSFQSGGFIQDLGAGIIRTRAVGASSALFFDTNSLERMRIDSSGNIGIGTTTPSRPMQIIATSVVSSENRSTISLRDNTPLAASTGGGIDFGGIFNSSGTQAEWAGIKSIKANAVDGEYGAHMAFMTRLHGIGTTEKMRITDAGSVGIGTTSPATFPGWSIPVNMRMLEISGDGSASAYSAGVVTLSNNRATASVNDQIGALIFAHKANAGNTPAVISSYLEGAGGANGFGSYLNFFTKSDNVVNHAERMRITSTGNIGIGTSSPSQKLEVNGNIQSMDTYFASVTFADGWAVGDYKELVVGGGVGASGSSGVYKVALSATRSNWTETSTFETIASHADPDVWREVPATVANYYTNYTYRCFTVDANTSSYAIKFRVRAIQPSTNCAPPSTGSLPIYFKISSEGYNGGWTTLTAAGTGATVSGYRTSRGSEWNLYTGASKNAGLPTITAKEGNVGIGTNNPGHKLDVRGRIMSVNSSGLASGGDSIGFDTEVGALPGYPASAYSTIKTNSNYIYFVINGVYSSYISAGGTYTAISDRNKKENFVELDYQDIRQRIDELPLTMWNYKAENESIKHIGPMAQDFHRLFGLNGSNDKMIANMDTTGVALAGVKSLSKVISEQEDQIKALKNKNAELETRLKKIEDALLRKPASR